MGLRGKGSARRHLPPPSCPSWSHPTPPSPPIVLPLPPSGPLPPSSPLPHPPRSACLCSRNCSSYVLGEASCHPLWPAPGSTPANVDCVLSPHSRAGPCYLLVRLCTALPTARPTFAQRPMLPLHHHPPHSSNRPPPPLEMRTNLEDARVGYTSLDIYLDSSPAPEGANLSTGLVPYLFPEVCPAPPDCCRGLVCLAAKLLTFLFSYAQVLHSCHFSLKISAV